MNLLNKLTLKNLKLNKKRTIVTIIGIMLSVALITAVAAMFFSAKDSIIKYETRQKGNYHYSFENVPENDIKYFNENRNFETIYFTKNIGYAKLEESKNKSKPYAFIVSFDENALKNLSVNITSGRLPENDTEIVIPTHLKTNGRIEYKVGDKLTLEVGKRISPEDNIELDQSNPYNGNDIEESIIDTTTKEYKVVGIMERLPYSLEEYSAPGYTFVTYLDSNNINLNGNVNIYTRYTKEALKKESITTANILGVDEEIFTKLYYEGYDIDLSYEEVIKLHEELGEFKYNYDKNDYLIMLETGLFNDDSMKALGIVAGIVITIIIFTSVFCIKNSFNISITEKIKQYGMLSSIGATSKQIKKNVYCEALMLGIIGIPLGILSGLLASYILIIISNLLVGDSIGIELIYSFSWLAIIFAMILGLITLYLSAWKSARIASKITPLTAIRNSEDIKIKNKKLKSPKYIKKIFGVGGDISYKNLKRNRKKYRATVISIIVCSSVFIALSAFINLAFDYVQRDFESTDYNIVLSYRTNDKSNFQDKAHEVTKFDNVVDYSIVAQSNLVLENNLVKFNDEYLKYYPHTKDTYTIEEDGNIIEKMPTTYLSVYKVGDHAYKKYLEELGLDYEENKDKAILINKVKIMVPKEENSNDYVGKTIPFFAYKKGDILAWNKETTEVDENGEYITEKVNLELAAIAEKYPFGLKNMEYRNMLILSDEQFNKIFSEQLNNIHEEINIYSDNATILQDEIEKVLTDTDNYNLYNTEEQVKQMQSFYLLVAIFLYGFITVIALIGITNIFNTITTNMELRSREFATLKSIGMTRKEFNRMISLESFFYGTKSLIIGIPIGTLLAYIIHKLLTENDTTIAFKLPTSAIIIATLAVFILITIIMKYSINKINKQNTIETIRNENI